MDPEELQEIGLFLILGIIWVMLLRPDSGDIAAEIINVILVALFLTGVSLVAYGMVLMRRTKQLMRSGRDLQKEG